MLLRMFRVLIPGIKTVGTVSISISFLNIYPRNKRMTIGDQTDGGINDEAVFVSPKMERYLALSLRLKCQFFATPARC